MKLDSYTTSQISRCLDYPGISLTVYSTNTGDVHWRQSRHRHRNFMPFLGDLTDLFIFLFKNTILLSLPSCQLLKYVNVITFNCFICVLFDKMAPGVRFSRLYGLGKWLVLDNSNEISSDWGARFGVNFSQLFPYIPKNNTVSQNLFKVFKSREILADVWATVIYSWISILLTFKANCEKTKAKRKKMRHGIWVSIRKFRKPLTGHQLLQPFLT